MAMRPAIYGDLVSRDALALVLGLGAMRIPFDFVAETPALSLVLATRSGVESGPYLRTPEGFVLGDPAAILDHLERLHPDRSWRPTTPVRRVCARLLEDWIELWLPLWPERAAALFEGLAAHLGRSGFLLGETAHRPDGSLAAWLGTEVFADAALRAHVERRAPGLFDYVKRVRDVGAGRDAGRDAGHDTGREVEAGRRDREGDAIPVSLIAVLGELARDYFAYLDANREALAEGGDRVRIDLGFGELELPAWPRHEARRAAIGQELSGLSTPARRAVRQMLEPLGAWRVLALPKATAEPALGDPRSL